MAIHDSLGKIVVGEGENADEKSLLGHANVLANTVDVLLVREEHAVEVLGLRGQKVISDQADKTAQVVKHFLVVIASHLSSSDVEGHRQSLLADDLFVLLRHFA